MVNEITDIKIIHIFQFKMKLASWPSYNSFNNLLSYTTPLYYPKYERNKLWDNPFNLCWNPISSVFSPNWSSLLLWRGQVISCWMPTGGTYMSSTCGDGSLWSSITLTRIPFWTSVLSTSAKYTFEICSPSGCLVKKAILPIDINSHPMYTFVLYLVLCYMFPRGTCEGMPNLILFK